MLGLAAWALVGLYEHPLPLWQNEILRDTLLVDFAPDNEPEMS